MSNYYLGIDPGVSGGVCLLGPDKDVIELINTPESVWGCYAWLDTSLRVRNREQCPIKTCMERVGGFMGKVDPGSRMFVFGQNYGRWEGVLAALGLWPFDNPTPQRWQGALGVPKAKGEKRDQHKRNLCSFARTLYPNEKRITLKTCDALLIAYYRSKI